MKFNEHSKLVGEHAFLSASNYHWLGYTEEKLQERYLNHMATLRGTELHDLAARHVKLGVKMPRTNRTFDAYVNDAIGYKMTPEQPLYYSPNCFGTADAISFKNGFLRIHDLKTGETDTSMKQLMIYAALFCLEYRFAPEELKGIELRIYQKNDIRVLNPAPEEILDIMNKIVAFDKCIVEMQRNE